MNVEQIKNVEKLLPLDPDKKIVDHKVTRLTSIGENYGSLMLKVDITVQTPNGTEEINTVVKMVPPNEYIQEIFNTQVTFRNEIAFYKHIVPLLENFQKESGVEKVIDFAPKYHGSRLNLTGDDSYVDSDAALVLENLKILNYVVLERTEGLDVDVAKLILSDLAHLHAVPLALKFRKPEVFNQRIKPYLSPWIPEEVTHNNMKAQLIRIIDQIEVLKPFKDKISLGFDRQLVVHEPREPYATITHNDCWINNNLLKIENNKFVKNKLVDYQICSYGSPARDLLFFLFSSVKSHILETEYDALLKFYYETFISVLKELKCDITAFSFEALQEELDFEAVHSQFGHVAFMLFPIFALKEHLKDISEFTPENLVAQEVTQLHEEKLVFVVNEFVKRNWI